MVDWQSLAEIAPILGAGLTGNPQTLQNTMQGYGMGQRVKNDQAERSFARELFSMGKPPTDQEISALAAKHGVDLKAFLPVIQKFQEDRQQKKLMDMREQEFGLKQKVTERELNQPTYTPEEKAEMEARGKRRGEGPKQTVVQEGARLFEGPNMIAEGAPKTPTTAIQAILGKLPKDASPDDIIKYANQLKVEQERSPYFTPINTAQGVVPFNNRLGTVGEPLQSGGTPVIQSQSDPALQGKITGAKEGAQAEVKKQYDFPKARNSYDSLEQQWDFVEQTIDKAIEKVSPFTAGVGSWVSSIPATPQKDLAETLKTIQANIGFDKLQDMRNNSPTGGALGQVSDLENRLLQAVKGSMEQGQSSPQLKENLANIKTMLQQVRQQKKWAFEYDFKDYIGGQEQRPWDRGQAQPTSNTGGQAMKPLTDKAKAAEYLQRAGGDKNKAREIAKQDGWSF